MKVANSLHQNQRLLNILSFEKALGYHLDRQAHRHQSNRQSAGHHPRYAQKSVGTYHPVSFRQSHLHLFLRVEQPTYPITAKSLSSFQDFSGRNRDEIQTILAVHRPSADAPSESSCHNTQRLEKKLICLVVHPLCLPVLLFTPVSPTFSLLALVATLNIVMKKILISSHMDIFLAYHTFSSIRSGQGTSLRPFT